MNIGNIPRVSHQKYPVWEIDRLSTPRRSQLYSLVPIGIGTDEAESFTSYLARLAGAHFLTVRQLVTGQIVPAFLRAHPLTQPLASRLGARINGVAEEGKVWCQALETLTCRTDLKFCSFLPWRELLDPRGFIRSSRAWCSICLDEWQRTEQTIYEPLLWYCQSVTICKRHGARLIDRCPACQKKLPMLTSNLQPGICSACGAWLGDSQMTHSTQAGQEFLQGSLLYATALGSLVKASSSMTGPVTRRMFVEALFECKHAAGLGSLNELCREVNITIGEARSWWLQNKKPHCEALLRLAVNLNASPMDVLQKPGEIGRSLRERIQQAVPGLVSPSPSRREPVDAIKLITQLNEVLERPESRAMSLASVAKKLDRSVTVLYANCPVQCRTIVRNYREWRRERAERVERTIEREIRQGVDALLAKGEFPRYYKVRPLVPSLRHPRDSHAAKIWKRVMEEMQQK